MIGKPKTICGNLISNLHLLDVLVFSTHLDIFPSRVFQNGCCKAIQFYFNIVSFVKLEVSMG